MTRFKLEQFLKMFPRHPLMVSITFICLVISLFGPISTVGWLEYNSKLIKNIKPLEGDDFKGSFFSVGGSFENNSKLLNSMSNTVAIGYMEKLGTPFFYKDKILSGILLGYDKDMFNRDILVNGEFPTEKDYKLNKKKAYISLSHYQIYGMKEGDIISILGEDFILSGQFILPNVSPTVIISANIMSDLLENESVGQKFDISTTQSEMTIKEKIDVLDSLGSGKVERTEEFSATLRRVQKSSSLAFLVELLLICSISTVTIILVFVTQTRNKQMRFGVQLAMGASKKDIRREIILEICILSILATCLDFGLIYFLQKYIVTVYYLYLSSYVFIYSLALSLILGICIGGISGWYVLKSPIVELMRHD